MATGHRKPLSVGETILNTTRFSRNNRLWKTLPLKTIKDDLEAVLNSRSFKSSKPKKQQTKNSKIPEEDPAQQADVPIDNTETALDKETYSGDAAQPPETMEAKQDFEVTRQDTTKADGAITDANEAWLASLDTVETPLTFNDPPEEFLELLQRFVEDNKIQNLFWAPFYEKQNTFVIFAERMTSDLQESLEKQVQQHCPNLSVQIVTPDCVSENLGIMVVEEGCNPCHDIVKWEETDSATCEVILQGTQPHKDGRSSLFAVTSAHLLLSKEEMLRSQYLKPEDYQHLMIGDFRNQLLQRMDNHVYKLKEMNADQILHLSDHPMFAYRFFKDEAHKKPFMTDIAILPFELGNEEKLKSAMKRDHCGLTSIKRLPQRIVVQMAGKAVYADKDRVGIVVTSLNHMGREGSPPLGHHISFVIKEGPEFEHGDSGSVIYTRSGDNRDAIAILKERRPEPQQNIYNAILLGQAIDEIQQDYPQFIKEVSLYIPAEQEEVFV